MSLPSFWRSSRRSTAEVGWGSAAAGLLVEAALLLTGGDASAEVVHYVDREGKVHEVTVRAEAPAAPAPPAEAEVEAEAAPPKEPLKEPLPSPRSRAGEELPYGAQVREAAKLYSLPVELILAVMKVESGFNPRAVSRVGAMGLMQLMPRTAVEVGVTDPFDPRQNVLGGARYLRILINGYQGDVMLALAGYHAGAGAVGRYGGVPPYPATRRYVAWVLEAYHRYSDGEPRPRERAHRASGERD